MHNTLRKKSRVILLELSGGMSEQLTIHMFLSRQESRKPLVVGWITVRNSACTVLNNEHRVMAWFCVLTIEAEILKN